MDRTTSRRHTGRPLLWTKSSKAPSLEIFPSSNPPSSNWGSISRLPTRSVSRFSNRCSRERITSSNECYHRDRIDSASNFRLQRVLAMLALRPLSLGVRPRFVKMLIADPERGDMKRVTPPSQASLDEVLAQATRVLVVDWEEVDRGVLQRTRVLAEFSNDESLAQLRNCLRV